MMTAELRAIHIGKIIDAESFGFDDPRPDLGFGAMAGEGSGEEREREDESLTSRVCPSFSLDILKSVE